MLCDAPGIDSTNTFGLIARTVAAPRDPAKMNITVNLKMKL